MLRRVVEKYMQENEGVLLFLGIPCPLRRRETTPRGRQREVACGDVWALPVQQFFMAPVMLDVMEVVLASSKIGDVFF